MTSLLFRPGLNKPKGEESVVEIHSYKTESRSSSSSSSSPSLSSPFSFAALSASFSLSGSPLLRLSSPDAWPRVPVLRKTETRKTWRISLRLRLDRSEEWDTGTGESVRLCVCVCVRPHLQCSTVSLSSPLFSSSASFAGQLTSVVPRLEPRVELERDGDRTVGHRGGSISVATTVREGDELDGLDRACSRKEERRVHMQRCER